MLAVAFLFQNMFVAFVSPSITAVQDFNLIRGHNFILLITIWAMVLLAVLVSHRSLFAASAS